MTIAETQPAGAQRLDALLSDLAALYPDADVQLTAGRGPSGGSSTARRFLVVPSPARPRAAVPADSPGAVRAFLRRDSAGDSALQGGTRRLVAMVAGGRFAPVAFRATITVDPGSADSIESYLTRVTGGPVRISLASGSPRANAKPVLGVATPAGEELGFCKVGLTALAGDLVSHEGKVLNRLAGRLGGLVIPPVLHAGSWRGHHVLFLGAVRGTRGRGPELPAEAMRDVAATAGTDVRDLAESPWATSLRQRALAAPPDVGTAIDTLLPALVARAAESGVRGVLHGASHGDWGPWNMAWNGRRAVLWDWERYATDVPVGMDAVHFVAHAELRQRGDLAGTLAMLEKSAEPAVRAVLSGWPGTEHDVAAAARVVVDCYLLEIACRFAADAASVTAAPVARLAEWYLEVAAVRLGMGRER